MNEIGEIIYNSFFILLKALVLYTIPLSVISFLLGLSIAFFISIARLLCPPWSKVFLQIYIIIIRGTPLIVQLFVIFYALPWIGIVIDPIPSAILGLSIHVGAYASETMRGSLEAVPKYLFESGMAVGFTRWQNFWYVLMPHAAYSMIPPLFNSFIDLVKATSLVSLILVPEIMRKAQEIAAVTNNFIVIYVEAACIYLLFCLILEKIQRILENKVRV